MNWSGGFLRLWLVVSAVYVAITLSVLGVSKLEGFWRPNSIFTVEFDGGITRRLDTALSRDILKKQVYDAVLAASTAQMQKGDKAGSQKLINQQDETIRELIKEMDDQDHKKWHDATTTAIAAFAPPLALLIAGFLIAWIIRGFRRN